MIQEPLGRLDGKVALITGGTSGIGAEMVARFRREGARVAVVGRNRSVGSLVAERNDSHSTYFIEADVAREEDVARAIQETARWGGRLDILVSNACGLTSGGVDTFTIEEFNDASNLVLGSVLFGIKHASILMKQQGSGVIINTSSVAALRTHLGGYLYSSLKAAVTHATKLAGIELGQYGIRVNCISPGSVATPLYFGGSRAITKLQPDSLKSMTRNLTEGLARSTPLPRCGLPSDVAAAAVFLASDEGQYVNCHDLVVDGGLTASTRAEFDEAGELAERRMAM